MILPTTLITVLLYHYLVLSLIDIRITKLYRWGTKWQNWCSEYSTFLSHDVHLLEGSSHDYELAFVCGMSNLMQLVQSGLDLFVRIIIVLSPSHAVGSLPA